jgi:hypothetical protein
MGQIAKSLKQFTVISSQLLGAMVNFMGQLDWPTRFPEFFKTLFVDVFVRMFPKKTFI